MSTHFSANQYENAFLPEKLDNWEVPQRYREMPRKMEGYTTVIGTDRGHIKGEAARSSENPWGNFVGTWDLPRKIPGNCAAVMTARSGNAQEKLTINAKQANRVLSGKVKNEKRQMSGRHSGGGGAGAFGHSLRSGAAAPAPVDTDLGMQAVSPAPRGDDNALPIELSGSPIVAGPRSPSPPTRPPNELPANYP
jgi:hypothetical protein